MKESENFIFFAMHGPEKEINKGATNDTAIRDRNAPGR
jgi:hypothetical protein